MPQKSKTDRNHLERADLLLSDALSCLCGEQPEDMGKDEARALVIERITNFLRYGDAERWRHRKRGTIYREIGRGTMQDTCSDLDEEPVVIYQGDDRRIWVRTVDEFEDGRFERIE